MLKDQKSKNFKVTQEGLLAFEKIKEFITKETFLYNIDFSKNLYVAVDSSNVAIRAFIYQLDHFPKNEQGLKNCLQKYGFEPDQSNVPYLIPGVATGKNCPLSTEYSKNGIIEGDILNTFTEETMTAKIKRIIEQYIIIVRPIYWYSKTFSECQVRAFSIMEKETLALVSTVMANRDIIEACNHCFIITDNSIILWAIKHSKEQLKISRWLAKLFEFNVNIIISHCKGGKNKVADYLSQIYSLESNRTTTEGTVTYRTAQHIKPLFPPLSVLKRKT